MKTIFTVLLLLSICVNSFAVSSYQIFQTNWRWRNNDGGEATATWKAAQDAAVSYNGTGVIRLRIEIVNTSRSNNCNIGNSCPSPVSLFDSLQYSTMPSDNTSWKNIGFDTKKPFVIAGAGGYVTQNEATTAQLADTNHYSFSPGKIMVTDSVLQSTIQGNNRSEFEWSLAGTPQIRPGTTYYFRQKFRAVSSTSVYTYSQYPSLTTGSILPVNIVSFTVSPDNRKIRIEWSVASGQNNNYFNVQRSTDGRTWETINKVNDKGAASYTVYDNSPPSGSNVYYRLQAYDNAGKVSYSDIRSVNLLAAGKAVVSILPNPTRSGVHFMLANTTAKQIQATLSDASGRVLHRQMFENVQVNTLYKLNLLQQVTPGIYILKLAGDGLAESRKVVVQ